MKILQWVFTLEVYPSIYVADHVQTQKHFRTLN